MNTVCLLGRMVKDAEVRYTQGEEAKAVARFTVAVDRRGKDAGTDFISCVAFGKSAEFVEKYFPKGRRICLNGRIQTGSYTNKDGAKVYTTDVIVDSCEFVEGKAAGQEAPAENNGFTSIDEGIQETLPFA